MKGSMKSKLLYNNTEVLFAFHTLIHSSSAVEFSKGHMMSSPWWLRYMLVYAYKFKFSVLIQIQ